jgi:hypothetical protein
LTILEPSDLRRSSAAESVQEIALDAIVGTLEPHRARQFDHEFRPHPITSARWLSVWLAEQDGVVLPPISVASFAHGYAIRNRHHRVSVARARGALTITAIVS